MRLVKYVLVLPSGQWLDMDNSRAKMQATLEKSKELFPGLHLERWTYDERPDGTHESPYKEVV